MVLEVIPLTGVVRPTSSGDGSQQPAVGGLPLLEPLPDGHFAVNKRVSPVLGCLRQSGVVLYGDRCQSHPLIHKDTELIL